MIPDFRAYHQNIQLDSYANVGIYENGKRMLEYMQMEMANFEWKYLTGERIKCLLFQKCIDRFGELNIEINGYPKSGNSLIQDWLAPV